MVYYLYKRQGGVDSCGGILGEVAACSTDGTIWSPDTLFGVHAAAETSGGVVPHKMVDGDPGETTLRLATAEESAQFTGVG